MQINIEQHTYQTLLAAVQFYADPQTWKNTSTGHPQIDPAEFLIWSDKGHTAKEALKLIDREKPPP